MSIYEIYVEKRAEFADEAAFLAKDISFCLQIDKITKIRIINRFFIEGICEKDYLFAKNTIFSEPPVDIVYDSQPSFNSENVKVFAVEFLPGQFDQKADSCAQCISLARSIEKPIVKSSKIFAFYGDISDSDFSRIKSWMINPVESREASMEKPKTLIQKYPEPDDVASVSGFITLNEDELKNLQKKMNLAMDLSDMQFCQGYFRDSEKRDPTITEIKVLDTYWSDHCRHTTFLTELENIKIDDEIIAKSYDNYLSLRRSTGRENKPVTLMDMATIGARYLKQKGLLPNIDESEEINACSVKIKVDVNGKEKDWLLMFKNETHNHPTEIEPFGGASTCLGGAIRDPLSGRAYVYQAMRVTGAGNPLQSAADTVPGKLSQRKICRTAAAGYSSYGNQIGLPAGHIYEIYHPGYVAKRMELGALVGAAPVENVIRKKPQNGDVVILLGGRTGRDGIGGATGSSKSHDTVSIETCGTDVQRGNAHEEHKIQRLFRNPNVTRLIKRCNDFGAGGVSVSVGELADGLLINLNCVTTKYDGLDGTELAISESQERMSVVVAKKDVKKFFALAKAENLEATVIASVTKEKRLRMNWRGKTIVDLSRDFLNSNGAKKYSNIQITAQQKINNKDRVLNADTFNEFAASLNICSQKGLINQFDSTIGAATAAALLGGKYQLTPSQAMLAKIPVLKGDTKTCSVMSWGFDPEISSESPYFGAIFAVVYSLAKIIASGGNRKNAYLSFQEYFERLRDDPQRWGKPASALLGALEAQIGLETAAIGGKDSMSGSFTLKNGEEINVPPTLVSFAVSTASLENILTPEFKKANSSIYLLKSPFLHGLKPDFAVLCSYFDTVEKLILERKILSCWAVGSGGTAEAILKMCAGNGIGFTAEDELTAGNGFGGFVVETADENISFKEIDAHLLGKTITEYILKTKSFNISLEILQNTWQQTLEPVYPSFNKQDGKTENFTYDKGVIIKPKKRTAKPRFLIPVFPGTNGEYDSARAIEKAGGKAEIFIIRNLTSECIKESIKEFRKAIGSVNALFLAGGSCGADEPDGSGKFITSFFCNPAITDNIMELIQKRDGLIYGIGNGFQALLKLGLLPYGEIREMNESSPSLTNNSIGRHQSIFVNTKVVSNLSPWLSHLKPGESFTVPVSHGEGRFIADENTIRNLAINGQIATQYVDFNGNASQDICFNPNNSSFSIEGITSPDGRIFGRMAHNERVEAGLFRNIPGIRKMDIFAGAIKYFA